jgi:hypothetical protein
MKIKKKKCYYLGKHNKTTNRKKIHNMFIYKIKQQQNVNIKII